MSAALITTTTLGIIGLAYSSFLGWTTAGSVDIFRHVSFGIFSTLITLLAHSMTMFYLIGKGKAVREATTAGGLSSEFHRIVARARRPVFSIATVAMLFTMVAAILGGAVDIDAIPSGFHGLSAGLAIAANLMALRREIVAMILIARVVAEVNQRLAELRPTDPA